MKIFFTGSQRGKKLFSAYYREIYEVIERLGHRHIETSFLQQNADDFYKKLDEGGREAHVDFYQKNMKKIKDADITIFECSLPSLSLGFQIEKSLEMNKPTIVLFSDKNVPYFLDGIANDKLLVKNYTEDTLKQVVTAAIDEAHSLGDKRFNFFITPSLLNYLSKAADEGGVTKSTFIRNLIIDHMKKKKPNKAAL